MSWDDIMRRVLPLMKDEKTQRTYSPHTTSPFGATNRPPGSTNPHRGVDFNYVGGQQSRFNTSHPALRSPVTGKVINAGEGGYGTIAIQDADGYVHEILHTQRQHVSVGDPVLAGQLIGTMGNTGVRRRGIEGGDFHVHYQLKDPTGKVIDPADYWERKGPIDPAPYAPAYLQDYLQYRRELGPAADRDFGDTPDAGPRYGSQLVDAHQADDAAPGRTPAPPEGNAVRILRSRPASSPAVSGLNVDVVGTKPNQLPPMDRAPSFNDRFGSWTSAGGTNGPLSPYQQLSPPPQSARPLGIVTGEPMPDYPFPPPIFGGATPGLEDWAALRHKPASWNK
ncbi:MULTISPECIES: M23 family metallopeptidase [unclassified Bradyrhizobium]|uniref:M23 family metallopeptidase n=1 Tax=unclassified Bradyrhizobium TaxID=2631580 RepID=UPI0028EEC31A|nr:MULTISPECIES: M23 family metallopeptidase [unclassified Bradyrhizobium]